jgi:hypothetical protein
MNRLIEIFDRCSTREEFLKEASVELKNDPQLELAVIMMYMNNKLN